MAYNKHQSHGSSPLVACQGCWSEEPDQNSRTRSLHCLEYADRKRISRVYIGLSWLLRWMQFIPNFTIQATTTIHVFS